MYSIGLTGSFGSGKTTVAKMFESLGARVLNADKIAHKLIAKNGRCHKRVVKAFGKEILTRGVIDRNKLAGVVFNDFRKKKKLEQIIHPEVIKELKARLAQYKKNKRVKIAVIDVPLLFESGLDRVVDATLVVKANREKQISRNIKRRGLTRAEILKRIKGQLSVKKKIRLADFVVDNRGDSKKTRRQVKEIWTLLNSTNN